jgi:hypothetical protein
MHRKVAALLSSRVLANFRIYRKQSIPYHLRSSLSKHEASFQRFWAKPHSLWSRETNIDVTEDIDVELDWERNQPLNYYSSKFRKVYLFSPVATDLPILPSSSIVKVTKIEFFQRSFKMAQNKFL